MTTPRSRPDALSCIADVAIACMFVCIAGLGLLAFLPHSAPAAKHDAVVGQLFRAPKIGLRAAELRQRTPSEAQP